VHQQNKKIIDKNLNPVWNETFNIDVSNATQRTVIPIMVFDHDKVGNDEFLGIAFIPLAGHFKGDSVKKFYKLHGVKTGEIEVETSSDFDLPNHAPILYEEVIRKAAIRTKSAIKAFIKVQKKMKSQEKKEITNIKKSNKIQKSKSNYNHTYKPRYRSSRKVGKSFAKGLRKVGTGLFIFGALVLDILIHIL